MGNDLPIMRRSLTLIALFVLLPSDAFAAPDSDLGQPTSLCTCKEAVLFSCNIGDRKLSLCGAEDGDDKPLLIQYRFGKVGGTPELEYPSKPSEPLSAFDFGVVNNTSAYPLQTISFNRPGAAYDIMTPDKSDYARSAPFTGVGVTIGGKTTRLLRCDEGTMTVNLAPLRKALGLPPNGRLSDALPKYPLEKDPYPIVRKKRSRKCKCEVKYPDIRDPAIAADIKSFTKDGCEDCEGSYESVRTVTATTARGAYLTLAFGHDVYFYGTPHGRYHEETKLFRKGKKGWEPLEKEELLDLTPMCKERINSLLYRQLKPQLSSLDSQEDLLDSAEIAVGSQGLIFSYEQYLLGAYAEGPAPVLLSYKMLGGCLRPDP